VVQLVECAPGDCKLGGSNPGLEIFFFFFLHNEVRDGGRGGQRPVLGYESLIRRVRAARPEPSNYS